MKIKVLKNKSGILSGVVIPVEGLDELKGLIKSDTELYKVLDDLLNTQRVSELKKETVLSSGRTAFEIEAEAQIITDKLYADAFSKGIPMFYKDDRAASSTQFIRANPDGSEDLVDFDSTKREYTLLRKLVSAGKGYWSYLIVR